MAVGFVGVVGIVGAVAGIVDYPRSLMNLVVGGGKGGYIAAGESVVALHTVAAAGDPNQLLPMHYHYYPVVQTHFHTAVVAAVLPVYMSTSSSDPTPKQGHMTWVAMMSHPATERDLCLWWGSTLGDGVDAGGCCSLLQ